MTVTVHPVDSVLTIEPTTGGRHGVIAAASVVPAVVVHVHVNVSVDVDVTAPTDICIATCTA
jgi:hypothetical protein